MTNIVSKSADKRYFSEISPKFFNISILDPIVRCICISIMIVHGLESNICFSINFRMNMLMRPLIYSFSVMCMSVFFKGCWGKYRSHMAEVSLGVLMDIVDEEWTRDTLPIDGKFCPSSKFHMVHTDTGNKFSYILFIVHLF